MNFLQTVRQLENKRYTGSPQSELQFRINPSLSYPKTEFSQRLNSNLSSKQNVQITANFLGLIGATGVLPTHYTQQVFTEIKQKNHALLDFYDLFHNRLLQLYYAAWRQQNLCADYEIARISQTRSSKIINLLCNGAGVPYQSNAAMLNHYSFFIRHERSLSGLEKILADHSGLKIKVLPFMKLRYSLPTNEKSLLSKCEKNNRLGKNWVLGQTVRMDSSYFQVNIETTDFKHYSHTINDQKLSKKIKELTHLYVGNAYQFKIHVKLMSERQQGMQLNRNAFYPPKLGKNTFLKKQ